MAAPTLAEAVAHLRAFRATFNFGDHVHEESRLTADDFDVILREIDHVQAQVRAEDEIIATAGDLA